jgi:hypothetical protein
MDIIETDPAGVYLLGQKASQNQMGSALEDKAIHFQCSVLQCTSDFLVFSTLSLYKSMFAIVRASSGRRRSVWQLLAWKEFQVPMAHRKEPKRKYM